MLRGITPLLLKMLFSFSATVIIPQDRYSVTNRSRLEVECTVSAFPRVEAEWVKSEGGSGRVFSSTQRVINSTTITYTLAISNVSENLVQNT